MITLIKSRTQIISQNFTFTRVNVLICPHICLQLKPIVILSVNIGVLTIDKPHVN